MSRTITIPDTDNRFRWHHFRVDRWGRITHQILAGDGTAWSHPERVTSKDAVAVRYLMPALKGSLYCPDGPYTLRQFGQGMSNRRRILLTRAKQFADAFTASQVRQALAALPPMTAEQAAKEST